MVACVVQFSFSCKFRSFIMRKGQIDCQRQVRDLIEFACDLIEQLSSLRDGPQKVLSDILSSHCMSIDNAFDNLVEEFSNLQVQVSELRKERTVLLETLDNLRNESLHSVKLPSNSADLEVQENDSFEDTIPAIKLNSVEENAVYTERMMKIHSILNW